MKNYTNTSYEHLNSQKTKNKISCFTEWKLKFQELYVEKSIKRYLKILSFHDLIQESNALADSIISNPIDRKSTKYSRLIMKEFKNRVEDDSPGMAKNIDKISINTIMLLNF